MDGWMKSITVYFGGFSDSDGPPDVDTQVPFSTFVDVPPVEHVGLVVVGTWSEVLSVSGRLQGQIN